MNAPLHLPEDYIVADCDVDDIEVGDIRFALWDDGSLSIAEGKILRNYPRDVVRRLARLLGVPGAGDCQ
jgi:hypothetical protein